jgi:hypothetical protein
VGLTGAGASTHRGTHIDHTKKQQADEPAGRKVTRDGHWHFKLIDPANLALEGA